MDTELRCGLVGPSRTRNGLGPFLASFLEAAGIAVVAAAGREPDRTRRACRELGERLGHAVEPCADVDSLLRGRRLDALVIASPPRAHLAGLRAASRAGVHVLCEKPLVPVDEAAAVGPLCDGFVRRGLLLVENCQWPQVLPAFARLYGRSEGRVPRRVSMRLSPSDHGRAMVEDSLSHFLSVLQALVDVDAAARLEAVRFDGAATDTEDVELGFELVTAAGDRVVATLELRRMRQQPREAWIEVDGQRAIRRIRSADYAMSLEADDGRSVPTGDPMRSLVYGFAADLRSTKSDRVRAHAEQVRERARLYADILSRWPE